MASRTCPYIDSLPDESLLLVLSFLTPRDLLTCSRLVSQRWRNLVDSPTLWKIKCERDLRLEVLGAAVAYPGGVSWQRLYLQDPFSRNLLRNPCGAEGLRHWDFVHRGDGWAVEKNRVHLEGAEDQTSFVTSFSWCQKSQTIDLLDEGLWETFLDEHQPQICISDWFAARHDCGCLYEIQVQLLAKDRETVITEFTECPDPILQWNDQKYQQVSFVFRNYGPGVRFVYFLHKGKDTQYWKGYYGSRITNSSVTIKCEATSSALSAPQDA